MLVVDDDPQVRELLCHIFSDEGFNSLEAGGGATALHYLRDMSRRIDIVLMDLMMPIMSGLDVLELSSRDVPVIVLTALGDADTERRAREAGAAAVLVKPFSPLRLIEIVRELLNDGGEE